MFVSFDVTCRHRFLSVQICTLALQQGVKVGRGSPNFYFDISCHAFLSEEKSFE